MKYFANIHNAEELRKAYRQHVINMHPDRGGNEEDFKAMQSEFEQLKKQYQNGTRREQYTHTETAEERARRQAEEQREREEWARWEAEERARREQEKREKAERIRKAQEENRAAVRAWAEILERVSVDKTGEKARFYRFDDKKQAAAFVAATKRNIIKVINHYFPGLKVKVTISGEIWKEKFVISWEDGPSEKQLRDTCKELVFFIPSVYCCADPGEDYGHHEERHSTAPWREAYGQALGDVDDFETARTLSEEGKQQAEEVAARYFANFDPKNEAAKFAANLQELSDLLKAAGIAEGVDVTNIFREITGNYYGDMCGYFKDITGEVSRRQLRKMFAEHISVTVTHKAKAPEFVPTYGPTYKAIKKALGANVFYIDHRDSRKNEELTIFEAAERLAKGEAVQIGHRSTWDGDTVIYGTDRGGYKTQQKRAQKFEAVGILLEGTSYNTYGHINAQGIKAETLEALRREAQDIDRQREAWEAKQTANESTQATQDRETAAKTADTPTTTPAADPDAETGRAPECLRLEEIPGGVAVVGTADTDKARGRQTYKHRKAIRANGATWNEAAKRWEATDPAKVANLRAWFAMQGDEQAAAAFEAQDEPQAGTLEDGQNFTAGTDEPTATAQEAETLPEWAKESAPVNYTHKGQTRRGYITNIHKAFRGGRYVCQFYETNTLFSTFVNVTDCTPLQQAGEITDTTDEVTADQSADLSPLMEAVADVLRIFADIMQQAKRWEGVTVPAAPSLIIHYRNN